MHETLDLCVSCKGCKRECPTGVDMAKMKIEFLAHYKARHGHTLRDHLFARLPDYGPRLSRVAGLANLRDRLPVRPALGGAAFWLVRRTHTAALAIRYVLARAPRGPLGKP